jgi:hypothetical protein
MAKMDSGKLSRRERQPGHDRSFEHSELRFAEVVRGCLPEDFVIEEKPNDLKSVYETFVSPRPLGIAPEAVIYWKPDNTFRVYFEVKKQGERGNAEERSYKHHTSKFIDLLKKHTGLPYHAYCSIFCEALAVHPRYTDKIKNLIHEPHYFFWVGYDEDLLCNYIKHICSLIRAYAGIRLSLQRADEAADRKLDSLVLESVGATPDDIADIDD